MADYVLIGHVTRDRVPGGYTLGGTVSYSGRMAAALGWDVGILTSAAPDDPFLAQLADLNVRVVPAERTTVFENRHIGGHRIQTIMARARTIHPEDAQPVDGWRSAKIVHLAPLTNEVDYAFARRLPEFFPGAFLGITPQGWFRRWDSDGIIFTEPLRVPVWLLARADAVILSYEDLNEDSRLVDHFVEHCRLFALTLGAGGATIFKGGREVVHVDAPPVDVVDPVGAGDIFAAIFFSAVSQRPDDLEGATRLAVTLATDSVTRDGIGSVSESAARPAWEAFLAGAPVSLH